MPLVWYNEAMSQSPRAAHYLKAAWPSDPTAWDGLNALFRSGRPPDPPLDGDYTGELLATRTLPPLDALVRALDRRGLWWLGKSFDAATGRGKNRLHRRFRLIFRLLWPLYRDILDHAPAEIRALPFRTWIGPGVCDPDLPVLKIDYAAEANPLAVRRVLDELVQVAEEYYLGKAHLRLPGGRFRTVGFFGLYPVGVVPREPGSSRLSPPSTTST